MSNGTSMVVSGGHGLGESGGGIDWSSILKSGLDTATGIYSAEQSRQDLARQREFELRMAKLTQGASVLQSQASDGETTQDGLFGKNQGLMVGLGVAAALGIVVLALKKKGR